MLRWGRIAAVAVLVCGVMLLGAPPLAVGATVAFPIQPPTWYHGDHWEWVGPMGGHVAMEVQSAATDGSYTIAGMGAGVRPNMEWSFLFQREQVGNFLFLDWPLTPNKRWQDRGAKYAFAWRVGPIETVTLPNGSKFTAVHLLCSVLTLPTGNPPVQKQAGTASAWYAPAAKAIVKIRFGPEAAWPQGVRNKALVLVKYQLH